jgi:glycosyltransferase involved in cell wall biosynthesis
LKILAVDHNALDPTNRSFYDELARQPDVQLRLIIPEKWFDNYKVLNWDGNAENHYVTIPSKVFFSRWTHRLIYLLLRREIVYFDPDILFMNSEPENFQTFQAAVLLALDHYRAKLVFTSWRNIDHSVVGFPYKLPFLHVLAEKYVLDGAAHGIVFNNDGKKIFEKIGFLNVTVIPPYVDTAIFHKTSPALRVPGTEETFAIGYIGRVIAEKGIDTLLQAVPELPFAWSVVIIGDGRAKSDLQDLAKQLHIANNVHWISPRPRLEIPACLSGMDAVVLPSKTGTYWREQFGRILIEAMSCETPVIGSDSGEIPNVIDDAGLVFREGNVQELRDRIVTLHDDAVLRNTLIAKGKERVAQNFMLEDIVKKHMEVFRGI